ncbi:MAG: glycosyltransferase family 2 protein [Planctomycetaceae bacterium]
MTIQTMVVIPVYNGKNYLPPLLDSLLPQVSLERIILVDNGSNDRSIETVCEKYGRSLTVLSCGENQGFGSACNLGIQKALATDTRWVLILNQDLIIEPSAVERAIEAAESAPRIGLLAFYQMNYSGDAIDPVFRKFLPPSYWDDLLLRRPQLTYDVPFVPAAAILLNADCVRELGGFDPLYFMYLEDRDLCHRLNTNGWKVTIAPAARVRHDCGQIRADRRSLRWNLNWYRSRMIYHLKSSPRSPTVAFLTGLKHVLPSWSPSGALHGLIAWLRCLPLLPKIASHRQHLPKSSATPAEERR